MWSGTSTVVAHVLANLRTTWIWCTPEMCLLPPWIDRNAGVACSAYGSVGVFGASIFGSSTESNIM
jgi:hypothetical protein